MTQASPAVVALVARIERFCAQPARKSGPELAADLTELRRGQDLIELTFSEMSAAFAATDEYDEQGSVAPIQWIRHNCHMGSGAVADRVAVGKQMARRTGKSDDRQRDRRLADALVELAHHSLDNGMVPQRANQRTHLQVTTTLETLLQRVGPPAADLEFSLPISAASVERLTCDCNVTRILLGADSAVIDVGRSTRKIKPATRRTLNVRDRGCRWPGCDRPASWTSGHHFVHWTRGGPTDLPNLVLLCYRHHWMVHEGKWQLVRTEDGQMLAIPPTMGLFAAARFPGGRVA